MCKTVPVFSTSALLIVHIPIVGVLSNAHASVPLVVCLLPRAQPYPLQSPCLFLLEVIRAWSLSSAWQTEPLCVMQAKFVICAGKLGHAAGIACHAAGKVCYLLDCRRSGGRAGRLLPAGPAAKLCQQGSAGRLCQQGSADKLCLHTEAPQAQEILTDKPRAADTAHIQLNGIYLKSVCAPLFWACGGRG